MRADNPADQARDMLWALQNLVIQMIGEGASLAAIASVICRQTEQASAGDVACSVLKVDRYGCLQTLAAPNLPVPYSLAINGLLIGPEVGSCGAAAYHRRSITTVDLDQHPSWKSFPHLTVLLNFKACWSSPIIGRTGVVIGTFAFYFKNRIGPSEFERALVERCTQLCAIAIEHEETRLRLLSLSRTDLLTSLPNRTAFHEDLRRQANGSGPFGLLLLDLNNLKGTNDTLGHAAGDALIRAAGERLVGLGKDVASYRVGGDEFAVLIANCETDGALTESATVALREINRPVSFRDHTIGCYVTIGGVCCTPPCDPEEVAQNADFALYHGKSTRRGGFIAFEEGMRTAITNRLNVVSSIDQALQEGRVTAYYQPVIKLETAEIVGLEALARVRDTDGSLLAAIDFHEAFAEPRLAHMLTDIVLNKVAADLRAWLDQNIAFQHVGINVTTADFHRGDLVSRIAAAFSRQDVPLRHIILEVNEAVFVGKHGDNRVATSAESLRRQGLLVALDDFGTGYASLTHLLEFPVDLIKIDKSFVQRLCEDASSEAIVAALIDLAAKLGIKIVAEGIETHAQAERLADMGCKLGQGYYYSRPVSFSDVTTMLKMFGQGVRGVPQDPVGTKLVWPARS